MARQRKEEPTLDITPEELASYRERAMKWLKESYPTLDPESLEAYTMVQMLVNMQISADHLISGDVGASVVRASIADFTTTAGTLLNAFAQRRGK